MTFIGEEKFMVEAKFADEFGKPVISYDKKEVSVLRTIASAAYIELYPERVLEDYFYVFNTLLNRASKFEGTLVVTLYEVDQKNKTKYPMFEIRNNGKGIYKP